MTWSFPKLTFDVSRSITGSGFTWKVLVWWSFTSEWLSSVSFWAVWTDFGSWWSFGDPFAKTFEFSPSSSMFEDSKAKIGTGFRFCPGFTTRLHSSFTFWGPLDETSKFFKSPLLVFETISSIVDDFRFLFETESVTELFNWRVSASERSSSAITGDSFRGMLELTETFSSILECLIGSGSTIEFPTWWGSICRLFFSVTTWSTTVAEFATELSVCRTFNLELLFFKSFSGSDLTSFTLWSPPTAGNQVSTTSTFFSLQSSSCSPSSEELKLVIISPLAIGFDFDVPNDFLAMFQRSSSKWTG